MTTNRDPSGAEPLLDRATHWLNAKLYPYIGPPQLGPYDPISLVPESAHPCPICRHPMFEHPAEVDKSTGHTFLHHPDAAFLDVMEFG